MGREDGRQNNPDLKRGEKDREENVRRFERCLSGKTLCNKHASFLKTKKILNTTPKNQTKHPPPLPASTIATY